MASADETKSLDPRSYTCGVCLEQIEDPRLLDCLHSFCRGCVDQLVLASSSTDERRVAGVRFVARCVEAFVRYRWKEQKVLSKT